MRCYLQAKLILPASRSHIMQTRLALQKAPIIELKEEKKLNGVVETENRLQKHTRCVKQEYDEGERDMWKRKNTDVAS